MKLTSILEVRYAKDKRERNLQYNWQLGDMDLGKNESGHGSERSMKNAAHVFAKKHINASDVLVNHEEKWIEASGNFMKFPPFMSADIPNEVGDFDNNMLPNGGYIIGSFQKTQ